MIADKCRERVGAAVPLELHVEGSDPALAGGEVAGISVHDDLGIDRIVAVENAAAAIASGCDLEFSVHVALIADIDGVILVTGLEVHVQGPSAGDANAG